MDRATREDMEQWTGCVAGALTRGQFEAMLADEGLVDVEIRETHRVHEYASLRHRARTQARLAAVHESVTALRGAIQPYPLLLAPRRARRRRLQRDRPGRARDR